MCWYAEDVVFDSKFKTTAGRTMCTVTFLAPLVWVHKLRLAVALAQSWTHQRSASGLWFSAKTRLLNLWLFARLLFSLDSLCLSVSVWIWCNYWWLCNTGFLTSLVAPLQNTPEATELSKCRQLPSHPISSDLIRSHPTSTHLPACPFSEPESICMNDVISILFSWFEVLEVGRSRDAVWRFFGFELPGHGRSETRRTEDQTLWITEMHRVFNGDNMFSQRRRVRCPWCRSFFCSPNFLS